MTRVVIAGDAIDRLADEVDGPVLIVADQNTLEAAGDRVARALGKKARTFVLSGGGGGGVKAGMEEVDTVRHRIGNDLPIAVGSGVITDIVRYAAHQLDRDFISVPTAASMDGYASSVAALQIDGVKVTYPARAPRAIFADPDIAAAAPTDMTKAGIGDLLGKATAGVDWLAAHLLHGERYDEEIVARVREPMLSTAANVRPLLLGGADAVTELLQGLIESGIAMALAGSSRPASGCEHHASHFWDLLAARGRRPHHPHGLQVGYATRFAMRLQRFAFAGGIELPRRPTPPTDPLGSAAREWLGEPSGEIVTAVEQKQMLTAPDDWAERWSAITQQLTPALEHFDAVDRALEQSGIPDRPGYLDIDEATLAATFRHATRLRARYTTVDFLEGQGALDDALSAAL